MLDLKYIRENVEAVLCGLQAKNAAGRLDELLALDEKRRQFIIKIDELKAKKNTEYLCPDPRAYQLSQRCHVFVYTIH